MSSMYLFSNIKKSLVGSKEEETEYWEDMFSDIHIFPYIPRYQIRSPKSYR
jgi:hypothetical protein